MIVESFSPIVRRLLAIGILLLALLLLFQLFVAPVVRAVEESRRALADGRFRLARLETLIEGPPPPAPPAALQAQLIRAPDKPSAEARLLALLRDLAGRQGLRFEGAPVATKDASARSQVRLEISVEGPADALTQWIYALESSERVLRFERAEYASDGQPGSPARFSGELRAIWASRR